MTFSTTNNWSLNPPNVKGARKQKGERTPLYAEILPKETQHSHFLGNLEYKKRISGNSSIQTVVSSLDET